MNKETDELLDACCKVIKTTSESSYATMAVIGAAIGLICYGIYESVKKPQIPVADGDKDKTEK